MFFLLRLVSDDIRSLETFIILVIINTREIYLTNVMFRHKNHKLPDNREFI